MVLYHFCAMRQVQPGGHLNYCSGAITSDRRICSEGDFAAMREAIGSRMDPPVSNGEGVIVLSISELYSE